MANEKIILDRLKSVIPDVIEKADRVGDYIRKTLMLNGDKNAPIKLSKKSDCTGCSACAMACGNEAISMEADKAGFLYPVIDEVKCVSCGKCRKVCPVNYPVISGYVSEAYAAYAQNNTILNNCASGGIFSLLARETLGKGGVVYGAVFHSNWMVEHRRVEYINEMPSICGSKYVQSDKKKTYYEVLQDLNDGKQVLFSGTHCEIQGLKKFLSRDYEKSYTRM